MPRGGLRPSTIKTHHVPSTSRLLKNRVYGLQEVRLLLNLGESRVRYLTDRIDFPTPLDTLAHGRRVWRATEVIRWALETGRLVIDKVST